MSLITIPDSLPSYLTTVYCHFVYYNPLLKMVKITISWFPMNRVDDQHTHFFILNLSSIDLCAIFLTLLSLRKNGMFIDICLFLLMFYVPVNTCLDIVG